MSVFNVSYKKVGGLHFVRIGRFGFSWFVSRPQPQETVFYRWA